MELKGKVALVTGGGSGLGQAAVRAFAAAGAQVAVLDANPDAARASAAEADGLAVVANVADEGSLDAAFANVVENYGTVHVCVNAAGVPWPGKVVHKGAALPMENFRVVVDINLMGTFDVMRRCAALMVANEPEDDDERGVIINVASAAAWQGQKGQAAYAASKAAVIGLTLPAARDLAPHGVRVVAIAPGLFKTGMTAMAPPEVVEALEKFALYPARMGDPSEFGMLARQVAENRYLNGTTISLDGAARMV